MAEISPLIYVGLVIYIIPVLLGILRFTLPGWIGYIGMAILFAGILHSIWLRRK